MMKFIEFWTTEAFEEWQLDNLHARIIQMTPVIIGAEVSVQDNDNSTVVPTAGLFVVYTLAE